MVEPIRAYPLKPLVDGWFGKIDRSLEIRQPWLDVAEECEIFFSGPPGFLWDPRNRQKIWGINHGAVNPTFQVQINKAFELVAIFGPTLYWRNPQRSAKPRPQMEVWPELFGIDEQAVAIYQQVMATVQQEGMRRYVCAHIMETLLNYMPSEYRLHEETELAITDALLTGRGVLFTEPYRIPGSGKVLVGSFRVHPRDVVFDGDAERPEDAWWMARKRWLPAWKVARDYGLLVSDLAQAASFESINAQGERRGNDAADNRSLRAKGQGDDLVVLWEVWSKCGPGVRLTDIEPALRDKLDAVCDDYCYLAMVRGIEYPLNLSPTLLFSGDNQAVKTALEWPNPTWQNGHWPCRLLDFYPHPKLPYPIPPLAPGIGELKAMNIILSSLVTRTWKSARDFIVVLESARKGVEDILRNGKDLDFIVLEDIHKNIAEVVQVLQMPPANLDIWRVLETLGNSFDRRVGLTDILYGLNPQGRQVRSATDAQLRQQNVSVRPEHMAAKVEQWQADIALSEAFAIHKYLRASDVVDLLGETGAMLFERFIASVDTDRLIRDIDYTVEANSARRPNRDKDLQNINDAMAIMGPWIQMYMQMTGNFAPAEWLMRQWGKLAQFDMSGLEFPPPQPPPPSPDVQQQQEMAQQQQQADMAVRINKAQVEQAIKQAEFIAEQTRKQQAHEAELAVKGQEHVMDMLFQKEEQDAKVDGIRAAAAAKTKPNVYARSTKNGSPNK